MSGNTADDPTEGEALPPMSVKINTKTAPVQKTEQFERFQAQAVCAQALPVTRDLRARLESAEYAAAHGHPDLEEVGTLLREVAREFDELADLVESVN